MTIIIKSQKVDYEFKFTINNIRTAEREKIISQTYCIFRYSLKLTSMENMVGLTEWKIIFLYLN